MAGLSVKRPLPGLPETDVFVVDLGFLNETQAVSTSFHVFEQIDPISIQIWSEKSCTSAQRRSDHSRKHCSRLFPCYFHTFFWRDKWWQSTESHQSQVTPLGTLRSGRELLMSKATDADVTVAGIALAMAVSWPEGFLRSRCVGNPWKSNCWRKGRGQPKHGTSTYFGRPCHAPTLRKLTKSSKEPCKKAESGYIICAECTETIGNLLCVCVVVWRPKKSETPFAVGQETDLKQSLITNAVPKHLTMRTGTNLPSSRVEQGKPRRVLGFWVLGFNGKQSRMSEKCSQLPCFFGVSGSRSINLHTGPCLCPCSNSKIHQGSLWKVVPNAKWNREEPQCMHKGSNQSVDTWATPGWKGSCLKLCMLLFEMKKTEQVESWNELKQIDIKRLNDQYIWHCLSSNHGLQKMKWFRRLERGHRMIQKRHLAQDILRHLVIHQFPRVPRSKGLSSHGSCGDWFDRLPGPSALLAGTKPQATWAENSSELSWDIQMISNVKRYPKDIPSLLVFEIFEDIWGSFDLIWSDLVMPSQNVQDLADLVVSEVSDWDVHLLVGFCGHLRAGGRSLQTRSLRGGWGDPPR